MLPRALQFSLVFVYLTLIFEEETEVGNIPGYFGVIFTVGRLVNRQRTLEEFSCFF